MHRRITLLPCFQTNPLQKANGTHSKACNDCACWKQGEKTFFTAFSMSYIYIYIYPSPTPTGGVLASQSCMATPSSQTWLKIFISIYHPHVVGCRLGLKTSKTISSGLSLHGHYTLGEKLVHYNCRWLQLVHYNRPLQLTAREYTHMNDFGGYSRTYLNWYCLIQ